MDFGGQFDDTRSGLSTSQVAALIAFGTFAVQLLLSFVWPLILVGFVSERESAVTWSVVGRIIHNSYWPAVLRTDATATTGVRRRVSTVSYGVILGSLLVGVAGVVTPLGLYEGVFPSGDPTPVQFQYSPDASALGLGTPPRHDSLGFSRICHDRMSPVACPHTFQNLSTTSNATATMVSAPEGYDVRIPRNVYRFFQGGVSQFGRTVSSLFDIEYRTYSTTKDSDEDFFQNGTQYLVGDYRQLTNVALNEKLEAIEGLVVDTKKGGIGFRNHTVPAEDLKFGAEWKEDILFIEPVTECVDTNITLDYNMESNANTGKVGNLSLVDHGGFVDVNTTTPFYDISHSQDDPELAYRAYIGAWSSNVLTMFYLNVTNPSDSDSDQEIFSYLNSENGKVFLLPASNSSNTSFYDVKSISTDRHLDFLGVPSSSTSDPETPTYENFVPPNPWNITESNFTDIRDVCKGALGGDYASMDNVAGNCGLVRGIPRRSDGSDEILMESGSEWTVPIYNCASATRAVVKTVSFSVNDTADLSSLEVTDIVEKEYKDDSGYPLWAVENTEELLANVAPLWGLAESEDAPFGNVSFKRHPHLWLTGYEDITSDGEPQGDELQNLPGLYFHIMAFGVAYSVDPTSSYSGEASLQMYNRWKDLTKTPEGTASLINLIWTDVSANAVVGTRGQTLDREPPGLGPEYDESKVNEKRAESDDTDTDAPVPVYIFIRKVKYKIPYAIPAFIVLALVIGTLVFGLIALVVHRAGPARIRSFLTRLSAGRLMTSTLIEDDEDVNTKRNAVPRAQWLDGPGRIKVDVSDRRPRIKEEVLGASDGDSTDGKGAVPGLGTNSTSSMLEGDHGGKS